MTKRQEAKRAELRAQFGSSPLSVANLIALLKTYPQDALVTGYNGQESTDLVTTDGVSFEATVSPYNYFLIGSERYAGPTVDIMGL